MFQRHGHLLGGASHARRPRGVAHSQHKAAAKPRRRIPSLAARIMGFGIVGIQLGCIIVRYRVCSCERGFRLLWERECARDGLPLSRVVSRVNDASEVGGNSYSSLLARPSSSLLGQWWQRARRRRARARRQLRWSVVSRHDG